MTARRSLRERHQQAIRSAYVDLPVQDPAYDGLYVRLRALSAEEIAEQDKASMGLTNPGLHSAVALLIAACEGIFEVVSGKGLSPVEDPRFDGVVDLDSGTLSGTLPRFTDSELSDALGCDPTATACVNALLGARSSLGPLAYGDALFEFSATKSEELLRRARGNSSAATPTSRPPQ